MSRTSHIVLAAIGASLCGFGTAQERCPAWTAEGDQELPGFGVSVAAAGDVNGDGFDDVIVGAHLHDAGETNEGRASVYLGSAAGLTAAAAWTAEGDQDEARFGLSVASAGDVNGDGFDDVIVGAPGYTVDLALEGAAFVYLGSPTGLAASPLWIGEGDQSASSFGWSVAPAGDVNGDGFDDVIVGAWSHDAPQPDEGRAHVYLGSPTGPGLVPAWTRNGLQIDAAFGCSVAGAGDVNGDGFDDVIVGARGFQQVWQGEGRAYVFLGSTTGLPTTAAWIVRGRQIDAHLGASVASAGDVNGDGYDDVVVGVPYFDDGESDEGQVQVYLGSAGGLATTPAWTRAGNLVNLQLGSEVASAGDVDGDGRDDVVIGSGAYSNGESNEGRAQVFHGSAGGPAAEPSWEDEGGQVLAQLGNAAAAAGDVDGDGFGDLIVGVVGHDGDLDDEGAALVYTGSPVGLARAVVFAGDAVNADAITPIDALLGTSWSAPLALGHAHGSGGSLALLVRSDAVNGPSFASPVGGRLTELLVGGTPLAMVLGSHDGATGDVPPQPIPLVPALLGTPWAAQYLVVGGGFADFSRAVRGILDACP